MALLGGVPALADPPIPNALPADLFHPLHDRQRCQRGDVEEHLRTRKGIFAQLDKLGVPGMDDISIFGNTRNALRAVAWVDTWHWWGFLVVVFLAAMHSVDPELYDAVKVDGGGRWREFRDVTFRGSADTGLRPAADRHRLAAGLRLHLHHHTRRPSRVDSVVGTFLYKRAFRLFEAGYAAAMG